MDYVNPIRDHDRWLSMRDYGIGGSDASVLLGWNPYQDAPGLWREKVGVSKREISYPHMLWWGNHNEVAVLMAHAMRQDVLVLGRDWTGGPALFHPDGRLQPLNEKTSQYVPLLNPLVIPGAHMRANVDGYELSREGKVIGGLEVKTASERSGRKWDWYAPLAYLAQVHHNAMCVERLLRGRQISWKLCALVGGNNYGEVPVKLDKDLQAEIRRRIDTFWRFVRSETPVPEGFFEVFKNDLYINEREEELPMGLKLKYDAEDSGDFPHVLAPKGIHEAVICDVVDRGMVETEWKGEKQTKRKVSIHFLLDKEIPKKWTDPVSGDEIDTGPLAGRPFGLQLWATASLHPRAKLRGIIESVLDEKFDENEVFELDVEEALLGKQVTVVITHNKSKKNGKTYANVDNVVPNEGGSVPVPDDYVRFEDRDYDNDSGSGDDDDDPLPF